MVFAYLIVASICLSFAVAVVIMPMALRMAHKNSWYDSMEERKIHSLNTPNIGGAGVFIASITSILFFYLLNTFFSNPSLLAPTKILTLLGALLIIHVTGIIDDFANLRARYKFLLQLATAIMLASTGFVITSIAMPQFDVSIHLGIAGYVITVLWLTGICNAVNFLDGMDGLSGGYVAIATLTYAVVFSITGSYTSALISFALFGAVIGFLIFNWPPAKIFMGDSGALFLGFALGALPFLEHAQTTPLLVVSLLISVAVFPVFDTFAAIFRRIRTGVSIIAADKEHIHHKLLYLGLSQRQILAVTYSLELLPCTAIVLWAATGNDNFFWLVIATWVITAAFFLVLDRLYHRREGAHPESATNS